MKILNEDEISLATQTMTKPPILKELPNFQRNANYEENPNFERTPNFQKILNHK